MKQTILFILSISLLISVSAQTEERLTYPIDTLFIPHHITKIRSYYSAVEKTQVNTYFFIDSAGHAVFNYCINSLYPTTTFVLDNNFSNYFVVDRNNIIMEYQGDNRLFCKDNANNITGILERDIGMEGDEPYALWTWQYAYYVPLCQDSGLLYSHRVLKSLNNYKKNLESRERKFSQPMITECTLNKERFAAQRGIGLYPASHLSKDSTYNHYWFWTAMNKDLDIVTAYFFIDSLYVIHRDNTQSRHFFKSQYQHHVNETIDTAKANDYLYLSEKSCESTSYMYLRYDAYRDLYYVVVSKAMTYENEDGTHNDAADKPWSLIVLDSEFNQKAEIDMPNHLSKHELMIVPEGLAVKDPTLSDKNNFCFIIYNIEL